MGNEADRVRAKAATGDGSPAIGRSESSVSMRRAVSDGDRTRRRPRLLPLGAREHRGGLREQKHSDLSRDRFNKYSEGSLDQIIRPIRNSTRLRVLKHDTNEDYYNDCLSPWGQSRLQSPEWLALYVATN
jgi:hypothetical protein